MKNRLVVIDYKNNRVLIYLDFDEHDVAMFVAERHALGLCRYIVVKEITEIEQAPR